MYKCIKQLRIVGHVVIVFVYGETISEEDYELLSPKSQKHFLKQ